MLYSYGFNFDSARPNTARRNFTNVISAFDYDSPNMKVQSEFVALACLAFAGLSPALAQSGTWTAPISLSVGGQGWESTAAMDAAGNALALWDERTTQDQLWSRSKPAGGDWGRVAPVSAALQTVTVLPVLHMTANGFATAVWTDSTGIWSADRLATGTWNPPQLVAPGASASIFRMNARGDAVVAMPPGRRTPELLNAKVESFSKYLARITQSVDSLFHKTRTFAARVGNSKILSPAAYA
jgi:hypothetical protein